MNPDSKIMKVVKLGKTSDPVAPGALAAEWENARSAHAQKVAQAENELQDARQSVIDRGVQRMQAIAALRAELEAEQNALGEVVGNATQK